ncbi:MAG: alpha/beta hydrolase [Nocardioidaceae bacterium]|nr:alpha/beta hydrolase [Nocardioidaceae bacterium]
MSGSPRTPGPDPVVLETAAGPVEHVDVGSGPPVLFVHGSPGGCDQGALMTRFLVDGHRVIALSRPGFRATPLTDETRTPEQHAGVELALMDALDIDRFSVACWSGGGPSSYVLAARHPDRVASVVALAAVSTSFHPDLRRRVGLAEEKLLMNRFGRWLTRTITDHAPVTSVKQLLAEEGDLTRKQVKELTAEILDDEEQRSFALELFDTISGPRRDGFTNDIHQYADLDLPLADVSAPVLLVHARTDADVGYDQSVHAHEHLPDSRLVTVDVGTHLSAWIGPEAAGIQAQVREHLATHAP